MDGGFLFFYQMFGVKRNICTFAVKKRKFMPQIYRYLKLVFYFVARGEHLPPHVHVIDEQ